MKKTLPSIHLVSTTIPSPLGTLCAVADEQSLYLLQFEEQYPACAQQLQKNAQCIIVPGMNTILGQTVRELTEYFNGTRTQFTIPLHTQGTTFQHTVWQRLQTIPFGITPSYSDLAASVGNPRACRAVARANATNKIVIIIPCHRIINANGKLGGYNCGLTRKQWLLAHEKSLHAATASAK